MLFKMGVQISRNLSFCSGMLEMWVTKNSVERFPCKRKIVSYLMT